MLRCRTKRIGTTIVSSLSGSTQAHECERSDMLSTRLVTRNNLRAPFYFALMRFRHRAANRNVSRPGLACAGDNFCRSASLTRFLPAEIVPEVLAIVRNSGGAATMAATWISPSLAAPQSPMACHAFVSSTELRQ